MNTKLTFAVVVLFRLKDACDNMHLETSTILGELDKSLSNEAESPIERDWTQEKNVDFIVGYILKTYHDPLRISLRAIDGILKKVASVHGENCPELKLVEHVFQGLVEELKL